MIDEITLKQLLANYKLDAPLYSNEGNLGIILDIKDSLWGNLIRVFSVDEVEHAHDFIKKYSYYLKYQDKIKLELDDYEKENPLLIYKYNNKELNMDEIVNFDNFLNIKKKEEIKELYLSNIKCLTNYLVDFKKKKYDTALLKNKLKRQENDLKFALREYLAIYYDKSRHIMKNDLTLDNTKEISDISWYETNAKKIENKKEEEIKNYLNTLIDTVKNEEMDDKHLINLYSINVYKYNIEILKKQIEFVKKKIKSEKNFSVKGSKIHNIDEELKSFLNNQDKPLNINNFLKIEKDNINNKYKNIMLDNCYEKISGNGIDIKLNNIKDIIDNYFDNLSLNDKSRLILYNSFYKDIINFIIVNKPSLKLLKDKFDWKFYYNRMEDIIYLEDNLHYSQYFKELNFKSLDDYIQSLIMISTKLEDNYLKLKEDIDCFLIKDHNYFKELSLKPNYELDNKVWLKIKKKVKILGIPFKLKLKDKKIEKIEEITIYCNKKIKLEDDYFIINNYEIKNEIINKKEYKFKKGVIRENE